MDTAANETKRGGRKFWLGTGAGVAGGLVLVGALLGQIQPRAASTATPSKVPTTASAPASSPVVSASTPAAPVTTPAAPATTPAAPVTVAAPTVTAPTASPSVVPTKAATSATPDAGSGDVVTSLAKNSYVSVFAFLPKSRYSAAQAVAYAESHAKSGFDVVAVDGDAVGGLNAGAYAIGVTGLADFQAATDACTEMGFHNNGSDCFRRPVR